MSENLKNWELKTWRLRPLNQKIKTYKQTPLEKYLENVIPYLPFIFKNLRERVRCKWYFKYAYLRRFDNEMVELLSSMQAKPVDYSKIEFEPFEWELVTKR